MEAMNYSVTVGGKRLRPMLMQETYRLFGGEGDAVEPFMAAQEMIHTYSLVHDDLPAMDNDEYRRGKKTTWVAYGEDMAILAGDGLLNYAFETALKAFGKADALKVAECLKILSAKAGIYGMIGGQVVDVMSEEKKIDMETLLFIHRNKTSALIQSSMMIGAVLAGASKEDVNKIEKIGEDIGLAFQIQDDILDVTSSLEVLGKPVGSDEKNEKTTYITLEGFEKSKKDVEEISHRAIEGLKSFERENQFLNELVEMLIHREK
jgi:geranylgeranyl diphosphate synthase type II